MIDSMHEQSKEGEKPSVYQEHMQTMEYGELIMKKESIRDAINKASSMYPYEVVGKPETYSLYNAGWQDAIDYVSQLLGVDIDTADF